MKIPSILNESLVDKNGMLTDSWRTLIHQLLSQLQLNASDEGLIAPHQKTTDISQIGSDKKNGALLYDKTTHELMVCKNGVFKKVTTS